MQPTQPTLCWDCQNAIGTCSWSENFVPVKGWTAYPVRIKSSPTKEGDPGYIDSFLIVTCPEFIHDNERKRKVV